MKRGIIVVALALVASALIMLNGNGVPASAKSADAYTIDWYTIDGGAVNASGGPYDLSGAIGQSDAGMLGSGMYTLSGGFWTSVAGYTLHLPLVLR